MSSQDSEPGYRRVFGQLLLEQGLVTKQQIEAALIEQEQRPYFHLGEILMGRGFLTFEQLGGILERQHHDRRLGQMLLEKGLLDADELSAAIQAQEQSGRLLGHLVIRLGFCSEEAVLEVIQEQRSLQRQAR